MIGGYAMKARDLRKVRPITIFLCIIMLFGTLTTISPKKVYAAWVPSITYQAHSQNYGWLSLVRDGATAGTINQSMQMEALKINLKSGNQSMVSYRVHVADIGWQAWKTSGQEAGTTNQSRKIEAVQIKLTGTYANRYDVYYRVHVAYRGWLGWAKNGVTAGSTGIALRTEAIQIKLVEKGSTVSLGGSPSLSMPSLTYRSHVQYIGWQSNVGAGKTAGTTNRGLRLEALQINLKNFDGKSGVSCRAHVADIGWQGWKDSGQLIGTTNQGKAIEAVQINLSNGMGNFFDIYYRMHVSYLGWLGWAKNGAIAGTTGGGISAEAIEIQIVGKGTPFNTGGVAYRDLSTQSKTLSINWSEIAKVGKQPQGSVSCSAYALAYCRTILDGRAHFWNEYWLEGTGAMWPWGKYISSWGNSSNQIYRLAYDNINAGKPFIINVRGGTGKRKISDKGHYVAVVGYQNVVTSNLSSLSADNFLIIDPGYSAPLRGAENMGSLGFSLNTYQYVYSR